MIDSAKLLKDLQREVTTLEDDLRIRCDAEPAVNAPLEARYAEARNHRRTALTYKAWREEELTNVAVAWVLACVFIRFLEDNGLVETLHLAGPDAAGLGRARDQHELFFREHPNLTEREYLEHVFTTTSVLPAMGEFFDRRHNPLWLVGPSGDAAAALVAFWRRADPETGHAVHDFADPEWKTRFLGDLYQDLSEAARKRYALLQTPVFVEQFILDRTLTPAIETFGFRVVRMIDPTCGSGHFLLGGFARLYRLWLEAEPAENPAVLAQRALDQVFGIDLNPNVVAIARFRLLLAALRAVGTKRLRHAYNFKINVAAGDSLLHGRRFLDFEPVAKGPQMAFDTEEAFRDELKHHYEVEDAEALHRILGQQYHAVVGNPPYITVKDRAVGDLYRVRYASCHRQYSLAVPFMERFFDLAVRGSGNLEKPAGFVGQITANSFMKREFGKRLITEHISGWDLTHVIDTSGAYIPGHGTPTVILFGKNQPPTSESIRTVLGIRSEPAAPNDAADGHVWRAIVTQVDAPKTVSEWVSSSDSPRANFRRHPWSIGGGGASELKDRIDEAAASKLSERLVSIGFFQDTHADEAFVQPTDFFKRLGISDARAHVRGEDVRDWQTETNDSILFPYDQGLELWSEIPSNPKWDWFHRLRSFLWSRAAFQGGTYRENGRPWFDFHQFPKDRAKAGRFIVFSDISTHNHAALHRGVRVYNRSAPVIQFPLEGSQEEPVSLLAIMNSSVAGFWLRQVCFPKGGSGIGRGIQPELWEGRFEFDCTKVANLPLPVSFPVRLSSDLGDSSVRIDDFSPVATLADWASVAVTDLCACLDRAREQWHHIRRQMIAWQEELDWQVYETFGLVEPGDAVSQSEGQAAIPPDAIELGQRAFEIVLARRMAASEVQTTWFERHKESGSKPITEIPSHWPAAYRELVERRIRLIADDPNIRLIEQPEYKRRWNTESWVEQLQKAARDWLLTRLEGYFFEGQRVCELKDGVSPVAAGFSASTRPALSTTNQIAGVAQSDHVFLVVAEVLMGGPGYSVPKLVRELVGSASVPFLPVQRYKASGLLKRREWEHVWDLQRREDAVDTQVRREHSEVTNEVELQRLVRVAQKQQVGDVPVPPKYAGADFKKTVWWSLRGKLDVPKERWVMYPGVERTEDPSPVIAWAGWDHAQQARALAEYYVDAKGNYAFPPEKLKLLLAGLLDLEPWLRQWHSVVDPLLADSLANAIHAFLDAECHALGVTRDDLEVVRTGGSP